MLVRSSFFPTGTSSESATTSINNRSYSGTVQRSDEITVDSTVSGKNTIRFSLNNRDFDRNTDDSSTSQLSYKWKLANRESFAGKQLPRRSTSIASRRSAEDGEKNAKARKVLMSTLIYFNCSGMMAISVILFLWSTRLRLSRRSLWWLQTKLLCRINGFLKDSFMFLLALFLKKSHLPRIWSLVSHESWVVSCKNEPVGAFFHSWKPGWPSVQFQMRVQVGWCADVAKTERLMERGFANVFILQRCDREANFDIKFVYLWRENVQRARGSFN